MNLDHSYTFVPFEFVVPIQSETDKSHPSRYRFSDKSLNKIKIKNPTLSAVLVDYKEKPFFSGLVNSVEDNYYNMVKSIVRRRQRVTFIVQLLPNKRMRMTRRKKR